MTIFRPPLDEAPGDQSSKTPSGKTVPMAMSMMIDSMVKMIQGATNDHLGLNHKEQREAIDGN